MVHITHSGENIEKISDILDAAQKRFGLYGLEKTTMSEIAADINLSKGSIYYYFPDKEQLYKAVVEKEHTEFLKMVSQNIQQMVDPAEMLKEYIRVNSQYFRTLLNLSRTRMNEVMGLNPMMKQIIMQFRDKETALVQGIFMKGMEKGIFQMEDPKEIAILFIELMRGLRKMIIGKKEVFYLEKEEYEILVKKINQFTEIFIKGMKFKDLQA
jgi:AcrR family transcriptional regulator